MTTLTHVETATNAIQLVGGQISKHFGGPIGHAAATLLLGQPGLVGSTTDLIAKLENGTATGDDVADVLQDIASVLAGLGVLAGAASPFTLVAVGLSGAFLFIAKNYPLISDLVRGIGTIDSEWVPTVILDPQLAIELELIDRNTLLPRVISRSIGTTPDPLVKIIRYVDPLILDLDGDGLEITPLSHSVLFDADGDTVKTGTAWAGADDGLLVWDRNSNGQIDSGRELFGDETLLANGNKAAHGFAALSELDSNADGKFNASDTQFGNLRVWRDLNQDGINQAGELQTLIDANVKEIRISSTASNQNYGDAILAQRGSFTRNDNSEGEVGSFVLAQNHFVRSFTPITVSQDAAHLMNIGGSGWVRDLQEAATQNPELILLYNQAKSAITHEDFAESVALLLREWGSKSAYNSASKQALDAGFGLILSDPINDQERGWMEKAIKASTEEREVYRAMLSPEDLLNFDAMRERMVGRLEKIEAYEAFTGHTFLNWNQIWGDAVNYVVRVAQQSGGLPVETWVPLSQIIIENRNAVMSSEQGYVRVTIPTPIGEGTSHIESLWSRVVDDAVYNLMGPLRLYKYLDMIDLKSTVDGFGYDFTRLDTAITTATTSSVQEGLALVFDLYRSQGQFLESLGYKISDRVHEFVQRISSDPEVRNAWIANGSNILPANMDGGSSGQDIYIGNSQVNNFVAGLGDDILVGQDGDDGLSGGVGNDLIFGNAGNDFLNGGDGNDTLEGGNGNDSLHAGLGRNTYIFGKGDGQDLINITDSIQGSEKSNTLLFKDNIEPSEISLRQIFYPDLGSDYWSLEVSIIGTNDKITIDRFSWGLGNFSDGGGGNVKNQFNAVQQIAFSKGTVWNLDEILEKLYSGAGGNDSFIGTLHADKMNGGGGSDTLYGRNGNDYLVGGLGDDLLHGQEGNDSLDGGSGNDRLDGGGGANTYHFGRGDGQDEILSFRYYSDQIEGLINTLEFKPDVMPGEIVLKQVIDPHPYTRGHLALEASIEGTADKVTMTGFFYYDDPLSEYSSVQQIRFADGTVWSTSAILEKIFAGTVEADSIVGTYTDNLIAGKEGADALYGRGGNDTLKGGADNDTLYGEAGEDILDGGSGNDALIGGAGDNTYLFGRGDGQDLVRYDETDYGPEGRFNTLQFKAGVAPGDLVLEQGSSNWQLKVSIAGTTDSIAIDTFFFQDNPASTRNGIQQFKFDDGTVWSIATILEKVLQGSDVADSIVGTIGDDTITGQGGDDMLVGRGGHDELYGGDGNDVLWGEHGNDTLDGGAGNDKLEGGFGYDTYMFGKNDGRDLISRGVSYNPSAEFGTLQFKAGVTQNEILLKRVSNFNQGIDQGLEVSFAGATDTITINHFFSDDDPTNLDNGVRQFKFVDGSSWDLAGILARMYTGTAAADTLVGTVGADAITGGAGADNLAGRGGDDTLSGEADNDILSGDAGDDMLHGGGGDDRLDGGLGADTMLGGTGNDTYIVDSATDVVIESASEGTDLVQSSVAYALADHVENLTLTGSAGIGGVGNALNNVLTGNVAANTLNGMDGNDTLNGLGGADTLVGGKGDDTYVVDNTADLVTESAGEGIDLVQSSVTFTLAANSENLTLTGSSSLNGTGNTLNNVLTGNSAGNTLNGMDGNDTLNGGAGIDTMLGGAGDDTYVVDNTADVVTEGTSAGIDLVQSSVTYTLAANVENLTLTGSSVINATGNSVANVLVGNSAANLLNGGAGADTLAGGAGNDTYVVDDAADVVTEMANEGTDLVQASVNFTLAANVENLTLTGTAGINGTGNAGANVVTGNSGANVIDGGTGADTMAGGTGDDTYVVDSASDVVTEGSGAGTDSVQSSVNYTLGANVENLTLTGAAINATGNTLANILTGNSAANVLNGAAGSDTMAGGGGDDTYIVDNATDVVIEAVDEGADLVQSSVAYTLAANVERLTLTGTAAINGTGNAANNTLTGNSAANVLNGGTGADTMVGGLGNDTYVVDVTADAVIEAAGAGTDIVQSSVSYTLAENVENLTLTGTAATNGTGNAAANVLAGNAAANVLDGGAGADSMAGGAGDDAYVVDNAADVVTEAASSGVDSVRSSIVYTLGANVENLTLTGSTGINGTGNSLGNFLTGNSGANSLSSLAGDDTLDGGAGNDSLIGGAGNDAYLFGRGDGQDTLVENDATAGNQDRLVFKSGVAVADVSAVREGDALVLKIGGSTDQVRVNGYFTNNGVNSAMVEEVRFTDSPTTVWNYAYISALVVNSAPVLTAALADQSGTADSPFEWTVPGSFSDPDAGAVLSYSAQLEDGSALPSWLAFHPGTQKFIGTPGASEVGTLQVKVVAQDQFGTAVSDVFVLTIEANQAGGIRGTSGADTLTGADGNDLIYGEAGNDTLLGGAGNDTLDGGTGADAMSGGTGDDVFIVDDVADTVTELASEGTDLVESSATFSLVGGYVESLTLTGTAAINGTGNSQSNTLTGNTAANTLNGGTGVDAMVGGVGDDTYIVDNTGDVVTEDVDGGTDLVQSSVTRTLGANQENLTLTGSSGINGTGNSLANVLTGNGAANTLTGWGGDDILMGGKGADLLVGGDGHDVYMLRRGDGIDTVSESGSTATNLDSAQFGEDIAADQLWFRQVGNNLEVSILGSGDRFSVYNWYSGTQYRVERFESGDGQLLLSGQVQNLVQAMASFSPPVAGQTTMPPDYAATLAPVIAANWQ